MKKSTIALLLLALMFVSACKKDKTEDPARAQVSFKVDGTLKQASGFTKVTAFYYSSQKTIQLMGNLDNNQAISIGIDNYNGAGNYDVAGNSVVASWVTDLTGGLNGTHLGSTGSINITTSTANYVKGTFQFVVRDPVTDAVRYTITEGKFESKVTAM